MTSSFKCGQGSCMYCHNECLNGMGFNCRGCTVVDVVRVAQRFHIWIYCSSCSRLSSIDPQPYAQVIVCDNSPMLSNIGFSLNITRLDCSKCPLLLSLPFTDRLTEFKCGGCPLLHLELKLFIKCNGMDGFFGWEESTRSRNGISSRFQSAFLYFKAKKIWFREAI